MSGRVKDETYNRDEVMLPSEIEETNSRSWIAEMEGVQRVERWKELNLQKKKRER
jgi:hypothetical protein